MTAALDELPPEYRAVVVLRDVEGLSHRDIGEVVGITVASAKTRVHRARLFLRKRLVFRIRSKVNICHGILREGIHGQSRTPYCRQRGRPA